MIVHQTNGDELIFDEMSVDEVSLNEVSLDEVSLDEVIAPPPNLEHTVPMNNRVGPSHLRHQKLLIWL